MLWKWFSFTHNLYFRSSRVWKEERVCSPHCLISELIDRGYMGQILPVSFFPAYYYHGIHFHLEEREFCNKIKYGSELFSVNTPHSVFFKSFLQTQEIGWIFSKNTWCVCHWSVVFWYECGLRRVSHMPHTHC